MMVSAKAVVLVRRSLEMAGHDPAQVGVRIRQVGGELMPRFTRAPRDGDEVVEAGGVRLFIDRRVVEENPGGEIGVSQEHERLVIVSGASEGQEGAGQT